jgi:tRNA(Ile)-lysidine synthase
MGVAGGEVERVCEVVRAAGLLAGSGPLVAMLSGGRDSVCLLDVAVALRGPGAVHALHVNYGLRAGADGDERHCASLCAALGVELSVVHAQAGGAGEGATGGEPWTGSGTGAGGEAAAGEGNLQAWARALRYGAAERLASELEDGAGGRDSPATLVATGHTASDQVETILYRLAASPGRRALLGMPAREGRLVRPLLSVSRERTAAYCEQRGLSWRDDESNEDERFARARVRRLLVPALRRVHPAAEANVLRTARLLREEAASLDELVDCELGDAQGIALARLAELAPALARLVVIRLAERAVGTYVPQAGERVAELLALGARGGRSELHLGRFAGAVIEEGVLSVRRLQPGESSERGGSPPDGAERGGSPPDGAERGGSPPEAD